MCRVLGYLGRYLGLLDGGVATVTSVTRERCALLAIEAGDFAALMGDGCDAT